MTCHPSRRFISVCIVFGLLIANTVWCSGVAYGQTEQEPANQLTKNWPRFHGVNGTGLALQSKLPTDISDTDYRWRVELAGTGSSSPVIWQDNLFVTSCDSQTGRLTLQCLDLATGKEKWNQSFDSAPYQVHNLNSFASSTPAVDDRHVYLTYASPDHTMLVAVDHSGTVKWKRDFGTWRSQHGFGISPMVCRDKVILVNSQIANPQDGATGGSRVIAVNCLDGADAWETPLTATRTCYALPCLYQAADGAEQLISYNTGDGFFSLDPDTGKENWKSASSPFRMRTVASTLIVGDMLVGSNGSGGGGNYLVTVQLADKIKQPPTQRYQIRAANYVPSPVAVDGRLYVFTDKGVGRCVELATGKKLWEQRLSRGFSSSPVSDGKSVYMMDDAGDLFVIAVEDEYRLLSKHSLGEAGTASPAISGDRIYLRTDSHLICVE